MKKTPLSLILTLVFVLALTSGVLAQPGPPETTYNIEFSGETTVYLYQSTTLTATWTTSRDVNRYAWKVDGEVEKLGIYQGNMSGVETFTFTGTELGEFEVCFEIWHHIQTERYFTECVTVTVIAPEPEDCPAAPAIAGAYLKDVLGYHPSDPVFKMVIQAVAHETGVNGELWAGNACELWYAQAVMDFVDAFLGIE